MKHANRLSPHLGLSEIDAHINDQAFADKVFEILDGWIAYGTVKTHTE